MFFFEFSKFYSTDYEDRRDFLADLDRFLGSISKGWKHGVEFQNKHFLNRNTSQCCRGMVWRTFSIPGRTWLPVSEQLALPGSITTPEFSGARFLLKPGHKYEKAVKMFVPYNEMKETYPENRSAGTELIIEDYSGGRSGNYFFT